LLNAALVFRKHVAPAIDARAWLPFLQTVLAVLAAQAEKPTLVLWGKIAEQLSKLPETGALAAGGCGASVQPELYRARRGCSSCSGRWRCCGLEQSNRGLRGRLIRTGRRLENVPPTTPVLDPSKTSPPEFAILD
jgi:hypothetical protein